MSVLHPKVGEKFGLVWRIMLLEKRRITKKLGYVALIINDLNKRRVGGSMGHIRVSIFEAYNLVVARTLV